MKRLSIVLCSLAMVSNLLSDFPFARAAEFTVVHSFCTQVACPDGSSPYARLLAYDGKLYGTTYQGGAHNYGTVFSISLESGVEKVVHSFQDDGADGVSPAAGLINVNGTLYGTTRYGGSYDEVGTVFSLDPKTDAVTVLYAFSYENMDGNYPQAGVIDVNGTLYGTTVSGGRCCGTVYSLDVASGTETVLYAFCSEANCADGGGPQSGLVSFKGKLYGTAYNGGGHLRGGVFAIDRKAGAYTMLHSFNPNGRDGLSPSGGLIAVHGMLFGTTSAGGKHGGGTVFSIDPATGSETVLYSFCKHRDCRDGQNPGANLLEVNGTLYGTTVNGGTYGYGTVFSFDSNTGNETVLHSFNNDDGAMPEAALIKADGMLFGTTFGGGNSDSTCPWRCGTVFSVTLPLDHNK